MVDFLIGRAYASGFGLGNINTKNPLPFDSTVDKIIDVILLIAGILVVIYLVYSGIQYITASGDATKATAARTGIVNAIIGIVIILIAFSIISWVKGAVNKGNPDSGGGGTFTPTTPSGGGTGGGGPATTPTTPPAPGAPADGSWPTGG